MSSSKYTQTIINLCQNLYIHKDFVPLRDIGYRQGYLPFAEAIKACDHQQVRDAIDTWCQNSMTIILDVMQNKSELRLPVGNPNTSLWHSQKPIRIFNHSDIHILCDAETDTVVSMVIRIMLWFMIDNLSSSCMLKYLSLIGDGTDENHTLRLLHWLMKCVTSSVYYSSTSHFRCDDDRIIFQALIIGRVMNYTTSFFFKCLGSVAPPSIKIPFLTIESGDTNLFYQNKQIDLVDFVCASFVAMHQRYHPWMGISSTISIVYWANLSYLKFEKKAKRHLQLMNAHKYMRDLIVSSFLSVKKQEFNSTPPSSPSTNTDVTPRTKNTNNTREANTIKKCNLDHENEVRTTECDHISNGNYNNKQSSIERSVIPFEVFDCNLEVSKKSCRENDVESDVNGTNDIENDSNVQFGSDSETMETNHSFHSEDNSKGEPDSESEFGDPNSSLDSSDLCDDANTKTTMLSGISFQEISLENTYPELRLLNHTEKDSESNLESTNHSIEYKGSQLESEDSDPSCDQQPVSQGNKNVKKKHNKDIAVQLNKNKNPCDYDHKGVAAHDDNYNNPTSQQKKGNTSNALTKDALKKARKNKQSMKAAEGGGGGNQSMWDFVNHRTTTVAARGNNDGGERKRGTYSNAKKEAALSNDLDDLVNSMDDWPPNGPATVGGRGRLASGRRGAGLSRRRSAGRGAAISGHRGCSRNRQACDPCPSHQGGDGMTSSRNAGRSHGEPSRESIGELKRGPTDEHIQMSNNCFLNQINNKGVPFKKRRIQEETVTQDKHSEKEEGSGTQKGNDSITSTKSTHLASSSLCITPIFLSRKAGNTLLERKMQQLYRKNNKQISNLASSDVRMTPTFSPKQSTYLNISMPIEYSTPEGIEEKLEWLNTNLPQSQNRDILKEEISKKVFTKLMSKEDMLKISVNTDIVCTQLCALSTITKHLYDLFRNENHKTWEHSDKMIFSCMAKAETNLIDILMSLKTILTNKNFLLPIFKNEKKLEYCPMSQKAWESKYFFPNKTSTYKSSQKNR